jgi:hypothetical protein
MLCHVTTRGPHAPYTQTPNPHTSVKPRGLALIPLATQCPIPGPTILTSSSSLGLYIVPIDQHGSFVYTLSSVMRTRENLPVGHSSQIALSQTRLIWRFFRDRLPKNKMHLISNGYTINFIKLWARISPSQGPRYHRDLPHSHACVAGGGR